MKKLIISCFPLLFASTANADHLTPLTNLSLLKQQIISYHRSGAYTYDIEKIADQAGAYLEKRVAENKSLGRPKQLAMVLDVDDTSLSNYQDEQRLNFGGTAEMVNAAEGRGDDSPIMPMLRLYQYATSHGVSVFFVTGRTEQYREVTLKNLIKAGYTIVKKSTGHCENLLVSKECLLYLRNAQYRHTSAISYKVAMRKKIEAAGYVIVANMGDQYSDLAGGYSERTYKYPNYMYYIP
jgi:predicted secreted acid phosphatase